MSINRTGPAAVGFALLIMQAHPGVANAAELKVLCSTGIKAVIEELVPQFEASSNHRVVVTYDLAANLRRQIDAGQPFDVAILTPPLMDDAIKQGAIATASRTMIAQTGLAVMIKAGGRRADISTVEAFRRALVGAASVIYAREGASGVAFAALVERLGIAGDLKPKSTLAATADEVGQSVVSGAVELGILPVSEILPVRGAELLAPFPAGAQSYIIMVGGVSAAAKQADAAADFLKFLTSPAALPVITKKGMERTAR